MKRKKKKSNEKKITCVKTSLKSVISNYNYIREINEIVKRSTIIISDMYNFIKLYCIKKYEENKTLPIVNKDFLRMVLNTITNGNNRGRQIKKNSNLFLKKDMNKFYNKEFIKTNHKKQNRENLAQIFAYLFTDIKTNLENNIKEHFDDYLRNFIILNKRILNKSYNEKKTNNLINEILYEKDNKIFSQKNNDICENEKLFPIYIKTKLGFYLPDRDNKTTLIRDLNKKPQKYLRTMVSIIRDIENTYIYTYKYTNRYKDFIRYSL